MNADTAQQELKSALAEAVRQATRRRRLLRWTLAVCAALAFAAVAVAAIVAMTG
jgi:hypothetical protein